MIWQYLFTWALLEKFPGGGGKNNVFFFFRAQKKGKRYDYEPSSVLKNSVLFQ